MLKSNTIFSGAVLGVILPGLTAFFSELLKMDTRVLGKDHVYYILCAAINLLFARYFFKSNKDNSAYGVLASTFFCAIVFLILKGHL